MDFSEYETGCVVAVPDGLRWNTKGPLQATLGGRDE